MISWHSTLSQISTTLEIETSNWGTELNRYHCSIVISYLVIRRIDRFTWTDWAFIILHITSDNEQLPYLIQYQRTACRRRFDLLCSSLSIRKWNMLPLRKWKNFEENEIGSALDARISHLKFWICYFKIMAEIFQTHHLHYFCVNRQQGLSLSFRCRNVGKEIMSAGSFDSFH